MLQRCMGATLEFLGGEAAGGWRAAWSPHGWRISGEGGSGPKVNFDAAFVHV